MTLPIFSLGQHDPCVTPLPARTPLTFLFCMKVPRNLADNLRYTMEQRLIDRIAVRDHHCSFDVFWLITATPG